MRYDDEIGTGKEIARVDYVSKPTLFIYVIYPMYHLRSIDVR